MEKFEELREKRRRGGGKRKVEVRMEVESMNGERREEAKIMSSYGVLLLISACSAGACGS